MHFVAFSNEGHIFFFQLFKLSSPSHSLFSLKFFHIDFSSKSKNINHFSIIHFIFPLWQKWIYIFTEKILWPLMKIY
ncbi:unnamed protein product [Meloidogyne enterolobii]|uniref:Uncharacterized protein n=1 Tax=Meloidogyne enterolobii TaxID=390850 RepID=A0ACB0XP62_MELEN